MMVSTRVRQLGQGSTGSIPIPDQTGIAFFFSEKAFNYSVSLFSGTDNVTRQCSRCDLQPQICRMWPT